MSNQSGVQAAVRASTGTAHSYQGDWHALFDADGIAAGAWNERMLAWINTTLSASYTNINAAMQAYAVDQGFANWISMNTLTLGAPSGPTGSGIQLETGDFLLAENGDYLIQEAA